MCKALDDDTGLGLACEAIAKAYERQDKVDESIKYLQMFVEVAEKSGEEKAVSRACSDLGAVFNSLVSKDVLSWQRCSRREFVSKANPLKK
jgi:hypothetical protein